VDGFLDAELGHRQVLGYPPFGSLIRIQLAAAEPAAPLELAQELARRLSLPEGTVLGPAPLFRLRGRSRAQVVVKSTQRALAIAAVGRAVDELAGRASKARVSLSVDVDPQ
jgi:primosomal protein N' (replication factor Y)